MSLLVKSTDYINIYFWRLLSLISGFLSLIVVLPRLSSNVELFGLYSFCTAFLMYLSYADIGFLNSGQKFAAEEVAKGNLEEEYKIFGFTFSILILMFIPFSILLFIFYMNPELILNNSNQYTLNIASKLFLVISLLVPIQIFLQRIVSQMLIIRLKDYIFYRIELAANLIKIFSVFLFFRDDKYLIYEYFLFITIVSIISPIITALISKKVTNYSFRKLFFSFNLSRKYFDLTKSLAFSTLAITFGFVIYFELDLLIIGKIFGLEEVGIYAIGFTVLNFLRNIANIFYAPFSQRFNHLIGLDDEENLIIMFNKVINYIFPIYFISHFVLFFAIDKMIPLWVGVDYQDSIFICKLMIIISLFGVITVPAQYYFISKKMYDFLYILAVSLPFIFILTMPYFASNFGTEGIAYSKLSAGFSGFLISIYGTSKVVQYKSIINTWLIRVLIGCIFSYLILSYFESFFLTNNINTILLIQLTISCLIIIVFTYVFIMMSQKKYKTEIINSIKKFIV